jgi:hypothetical protein
MLKRFGLFCTILALTAVAPLAHAQNGAPLAGTWSYSWTPPLIGQVDDVNGGGGGYFPSTLTNGLNPPLATGSYCNDLNEEIGGNGQTVAPTTVYSFANLTSAQLTGKTLVSVDTNTNLIDAGGSVFTAGGTAITTVDAAASQAHIDEIEYLVANNWSPTPTAVQASELQLAIWEAWGYGADGQNGGNTAGYQAAADAMWANAVANGKTYTNANVLWVYNASNGLVQNQIMYVPDGGITTQSTPPSTPEGASLALLLPGLFPVGLAIRRKLRKA